MASNLQFVGDTDDTINTDKPIGHILLHVSTGTTFSLSLDKGQTYMEIPAGFHNFPIGLTTDLRIRADGEWQLTTIQT